LSEDNETDSDSPKNEEDDPSELEKQQQRQHLQHQERRRRQRGRQRLGGVSDEDISHCLNVAQCPDIRLYNIPAAPQSDCRNSRIQDSPGLTSTGSELVVSPTEKIELQQGCASVELSSQDIPDPSIQRGGLDVIPELRTVPARTGASPAASVVIVHATVEHKPQSLQDHS